MRQSVCRAVLAAFIIAEAMPSCKNVDAADKNISLTVWYPWSDGYEAYEKLFLTAISEYNEEHEEVSVNPKGMEMEIYRQMLPLNIATNNMPDIYFCYGDAYLQNIAEAGRLLNLDDYGSYPEKESRPVFQESMYYNGKRFAYGFAENAGVFLINMELFQKYGCEPPKTWEELLAVCQRFIDCGIVPLGCSRDEDIGFQLYLQQLCINQAGVQDCLNIIRGSEEPDEGFLQGVQQFAQLLKIGAFGKNGIQKHTNAINEDFYLGRIPMYYTKSSFIGNIQIKSNPLNQHLKIIPFPGSSPGVMIGGAGECFVVNKETGHPDEAAEILPALLKDFSFKLETYGWGTSIWENTANENNLNQFNGIYQQQEVISEKVDQWIPYWDVTISGKRLETYRQAAGQLADGQITAEEFVHKISN